MSNRPLHRDPLITLTIQVPYRTHRMLAARAKRTGRAISVEAGLVLHYALVLRIKQVRRREALLDALKTASHIANSEASDGE